MNLMDIVKRTPAPAPWSEGDNIPWNDPAFSERMLREHLSQSHDAASRRAAKIDQHVAWINKTFLKGHHARVLDLGCGPGLYTSRLASLGHECVGIDYSPASIRYAKSYAETENLACKYILDDMRTADYGTGFDLVMLIFGEFNVFRMEDAAVILKKANAALLHGGTILLEPHTFAIIQQMGKQPASWNTTPSGLFSAQPHIILEEHFWDTHLRASTNRFFVVDAASGSVTRYAQTFQSYTNTQYQTALSNGNFGEITFYPSLLGIDDRNESGLIALTARKNG